MIITKQTPVYLYGYSLRGVSICQILREQGLNVTAYIDRNAERYLSENVDLPIYNLDQLKKMDLSKSLVFVAVSNLFKHKDIAKTLAKYGFKYIICKIFEEDVDSQQRNEIYERIVDVLMVRPIENMDVPPFEERKEVHRPVNIYNQEIIFSPVPINLLFGVTKKTYYESLKCKDSELLDKVPDKSILYFNISKGLFHFFQSGFERDKYEKYIRIYAKHRMAQTFEYMPAEINHKELGEHLNDRYAIYQEMEKLFAGSKDFFHQNPSSVSWNPDGHFILEDGNNRACFLLETGMCEIPCKMKREDYESWMNTNEKIDNVKAALSVLSEVPKAPITHPVFQAYHVRYYAWSYKKLKRICEWLWDHDFNIRNKYILEIYSKNDLCGQHMSRMGANVTVLESEEWLALQKSIGDLLYIKTINYISSIEMTVSVSYDLILCDFERYAKMSGNVGYEFTKGIFEVGDHDLYAFEEWLKKQACNRWQSISEDLVGKEIKRLIYVEMQQ